MVRILIVEDDQIMANLYRQIFTLEKFEVSVAENGLQAIEEVNKSIPSVILLDIMMPKMSGFEFIQTLKKNPGTKNIPIVVLTNLANPEDKEEALRNGVNKYLVKSDYEPKQIVSIVKEVVGLPLTNPIPQTKTITASHPQSDSESQ